MGVPARVHAARRVQGEVSTPIGVYAPMHTLTGSPRPKPRYIRLFKLKRPAAPCSTPQGARAGR